MKLTEAIAKNHLYHAYVIEAPREEGVAALRELIRGFGIATNGNPDFHEYSFDAFLLDDANSLRREQSFFGTDGAKKIFVVSFNAIGHEAQNALLKTIEEPTEGTHFFFVVRTREVFLPTVLSRVQVVTMDDAHNGISQEKLGERFCRASVAERMDMVDPWTKAKPEEKPKAKEEARVFLESLERALYARLKRGDSSMPRSLEHVQTGKHLLSGHSPSLKLILEHLALTVPTLGGKP